MVVLGIRICHWFPASPEAQINSIHSSSSLCPGGPQRGVAVKQPTAFLVGHDLALCFFLSPSSPDIYLLPLISLSLSSFSPPAGHLLPTAPEQGASSENPQTRTGHLTRDCRSQSPGDCTACESSLLLSFPLLLPLSFS